METNQFLSVKAHSIYLLLTGLNLIFMPNTLLGIFGFEPTTEVWIKVLGAVVLGISILFYAIGKFGNREIIRFSMYERWFVALAFVAFVVTGQAKMSLLLFGIVDAAMGFWTWFELKR